jgi:Prophage minor tail protein Z (GPZ).
MSDVFRVIVDATEFRKTELKLGPYYKKTPIAISRALNRAAESTRTEAVRNVTANYYVTAKDARGTIQIYKASPSKLGALVVSKDSKIPLDHFKFTPKKPNPKSHQTIKVAVKKGGLKELLHAFIADVNGVKIFQRVGPSRLPIQRLMGPAIPVLIGSKLLREAVEKKSHETYQQRLDHEIKRTLEAAK